MIINKLFLIEGSLKAKGLTVIIDVFRAFSTACYLFNNGAERIITVATVEEALKLKEKNPEYILIGEKHEKKCPGFDFGNSPTHILNHDFSGKTIVHRTSSGTQGISNAKNASEILTGSFVNAEAVARYIKNSNPEIVSLVSMGYEGLRNTQEDDFCATYIENEINSIQTDFKKMVEVLISGDGARLLDPKNHLHSPSSDFNLCLDLNRFNFILRINTDSSGYNVLEKIDIF